MNKLIYDKKKYLILPENADELTGDQLIGIASILHGDYNKLQASLKALQILSNKKWFEFLRIPNDVKINCIEHISWIFEDWDLSKQLMVEYKGFYGPKSEFDNLTLAEFYFSELYYSNLLQENNTEALDNLVAVLYRKPKRFYNINKDIDGDIRIAFNANSIAYYANKIAKWPKPVKQAILIWYDGCRKKIASDNEEIFNGNGDNSDNEADMFGILRGIAGGKYGDFEKVEKMLLHTALLEMTMTIAEYKKLEAEFKKNK